jgi:translation initiation factor 5
MDDLPSITYVVRLPTEPQKVSLVQDDLGSRYKTRQLQVQQVGSTKMIRTYLLNVNDVAKDCQIPADYIGYFLGYEQSCVTKVDKKLPPREQIYLSGAHETDELSRLFGRFVNEVVACGTCKAPEAVLEVEKKKKRVMSSCRGCGARKQKKFKNDKFLRYVLNHPPVADGWSGNKAGGKQDRGAKRDNGKKGKDKGPKKGGNNDEQNAANGKEEKKDDEKSAPEETAEDEGLVNEELAQIADAVAEKLAVGAASEVLGKEEKPTTNDWATDTSEEAIAKRQESFTPQTALDNKKFLQSVRDAVKTSDIALTTKNLKAIQAERQLDDARFTEKIVEAVCETSPACDIVKVFDDDMLMVFAEFAPEGHDQEQAAILDGVEAWLAATKQESSPLSVAVLKHLYDEDAVEEDALMAWWTRPSASKSLLVRAAVQPFITWLEEAEEESEDSDESSSEES